MHFKYEPIFMEIGFVDINLMVLTSNDPAEAED